jgi:hypothetical protein
VNLNLLTSNLCQTNADIIWPGARFIKRILLKLLNARNYNWKPGSPRNESEPVANRNRTRLNGAENYNASTSNVKNVSNFQVERHSRLTKKAEPPPNCGVANPKAEAKTAGCNGG